MRRDSSQRGSGRLGLFSGLVALGLLRNAERDQWEDLPPDYRPPFNGEWLSRDPRASARLEGTRSQQDVLKATADVARKWNAPDDDDGAIWAWSWADLQVGDHGAERVAVMAGEHLLGYLPDVAGGDVAKRARRLAGRRKVVWLMTWIDREADSYIAWVDFR